MNEPIETENVETFTVFLKSGWKYKDPHTQRIMSISYATEFQAARVDTDTIRFQKMVLPTRSDDDRVAIIEKRCLDDMVWKIVHPTQVIDVFADPQLLTYSHSVFPNTEIFVDRSFHDAAGIQIYKILDHELYVQNNPIDFTFFGTDTFANQGGEDEHGIITTMHLVPMKNMMVARVLNTDGLFIYKSKELYSGVIGLLPFNSRVVVQSKSFTRVPSHHHVQRYQVFHNKGWVNAVGMSGVPNLEFLALSTNPFEHQPKNLLADLIHKTPFLEEPVGGNDELKCVICLCREKEIAVLHDTYAHLLYCRICALIMEERKAPCPLCRTSVHRYLRTYR